jgi:hypothetical protein
MIRISHASVVVGSLAALVLTAVPAGAETAPSVSADGLGAAAHAAKTSEFYAGYAGRGVGDAVTSASFRVPEFDCTAGDAGIVTTVYAISAKGEFLAGADLYLYCVDGEFAMDGHITTSGGQIPIWQELEPGDVVQMSIAAHAQGTSTHDVSFTNTSREWTSSLPTNSPVTRIEVAQRRMSLDGVSLPVPAYGKFRFNKVVFDDVPVAKASATRVSLVDADGNKLIRTGKAHRKHFKLTSLVGA